jgi:hypothetical protein
MLLSLAPWIQATDFFTYLRGSGYVYPVILSLDMVAIAFLGGMILMTDLRLLGLVTCALLMPGCKAEEYYYNLFSRAKLAAGLSLLSSTLDRLRAYTRSCFTSCICEAR